MVCTTHVEGSALRVKELLLEVAGEYFLSIGHNGSGKPVEADILGNKSFGQPGNSNYFR